MKRKFADMHLCVNPKNTAIAQRVIAKAAELGYSLVSVPFIAETKEDEVAKIKTICMDVKVDFAPRVDLTPKTRNQLMFLLRRLRRKFEVVCVSCENKEVARQAAKDRRVDLLSFSSNNYRDRFFDWAEAELASSSLAALEVNTKPLLQIDGSARVKLLSNLRREVSVAKEYNVPVVVSSGAETELLLRKPRELAALVLLLGLNEPQALDAISTNPLTIISRNREKLSRRFIAPGMRVIKEGRDC